MKGDDTYGYHYTGYHKNPNNSRSNVNIMATEGNFIDRELIKLYVPKLKSVLGSLGLIHNNTIYSFQSMWGQLYRKSLGGAIDVHNHYSHPRDLLSWVHFVKVPEQKCFYFYINGEKIYPDTQGSSDMIFYPSYANHGVDVLENDEDRFVVAGNISQIN